MHTENLNALRHEGLIVDLFAGGGGFSVGCEQAFQRPVSIALNHDPEAVALHTANHPRTRHICQDFETADPLEVTRNEPVFWLHASPSCTQHSRSRRALPAEKQARDHGWKVIEWIEKTRPVIFSCENVPEYRKWGPLDAHGFPDKDRQGETFEEWKNAITRLGYRLEWRDINAADLGAATARVRMLIVARRDNMPICWPDEHFGPGRENDWNPSGDHIDWWKPAPSIFTRKKPPVQATLNRIAKGIKRYIIDNPTPYRAPDHARISNPRFETKGAKIAAFMAQNHAQLPGRSLNDPLSTICSKAAGQSLVTLSYIDIARSGSIGLDPAGPLGTITSRGDHHAEVRIEAFAAGYYSQGGGQLHDLNEPIGTITTRDRFAVVEIESVKSIILDIGYRFLTADELWSITGFPDDYKRSVVAKGRPMPATAQKRMIGNAVVPIVAKAVVAANLKTYDNDNLKMAA